MRIEAPISVDEFGFPFEAEDRSDIYKEMGILVFRKLEESKLGTTFVELSDLPKSNVELLRSGIRYHIVKKAATCLYEIYSRIITDPNDSKHHILIFSKKPWEEVIWEEIIRRVNQTDG